MLCERFIQWQNFSVSRTIEPFSFLIGRFTFSTFSRIANYWPPQLAPRWRFRHSSDRHGGSAMIATKHSDITTTVPLCLGGNHGSICFDMKCFHGSHVVLVSVLQRTQNSSILCLTCALSITPPPDGGWEVWGGSVHAWSLPLSGHAQGLEGVGAWGELLEIGRSSAVFHGSRNRSGNHPCKLKNGTTFMVSASSFNTQEQHLGWSPLQRQDRQFRFGQKASWLLYSMLPSFLLPLVPTITQKNSTGDNLSQGKSKTV